MQNWQKEQQINLRGRYFNQILQENWIILFKKFTDTKSTIL